MDRHTKANLKVWNSLVGINLKSKLYDLDGFKSGKSSLPSIQVKEIAREIIGKSVLHLQCHFGMDTLSLARLGAKKVTGVDFSPVAISKARELARELGLEKKARFVCSDVYNLQNTIATKFDFIYTGGGALFWLKDLDRWGEIIAGLLRPKGLFYIMEYHPFSNTFDEDAIEPRFRYPYFHGSRAIVNKFHGTYSEPDSDFEGEEHNWGFGMGELLGSLINAGLRVRYLHEFTTVGYKRFPFLKREKDNRWGWKNPKITVPLEFSVLASKD